MWWNAIESIKSFKKNYKKFNFYWINIPYLTSLEFIPDDESRDRRFYFIWTIYAKLEEITNDKNFLEERFIKLIKLAQNDIIDNKVLKKYATKILIDKKEEVKLSKKLKKD